MKISTRQMIFRLTAAAIGLAATGVVFGVAVARSQESSTVVHGYSEELLNPNAKTRQPNSI
jgi:hypothetical protein